MEAWCEICGEDIPDNEEHVCELCGIEFCKYCYHGHDCSYNWREDR